MSAFCFTCATLKHRRNKDAPQQSAGNQQYSPPIGHMMRFRFVLVYSNKSDAAAGLVDLPYIQLLVLFQSLLELGGGEAPRDTALLCFSHTYHSTSSGAARHALCGELTHQREDNIRWPLSPEQKIKT